MWALTNFDQGMLGLLLVFSGGGGQSERFMMSRMVVSPTASRVPELAEDALVAPGEVLGRHAQDQRHEILDGAGSSGRVRAAGLGLRTQPALVGLRLDHQHDVADVVVDSTSQPQEIGPLLGRGDNALIVYPVAQHFDLEHQQLHPDIVFRQKLMRQKGEKNKEKIYFHAQPTILHRIHILLISICFNRCICFRAPRKAPDSPLRQTKPESGR
jgi:hypothetical protein